MELTHDELLAKIDEIEIKTNNTALLLGVQTALLTQNKALRAVVELHKPIEEEGKLWCKHEACYSHIEFLERTDCECAYPCPTIQAIAKELG